MMNLFLPLRKIDSKKESKKIIAFDTWSLDYVLKTISYEVNFKFRNN